MTRGGEGQAGGTYLVWVWVRFAGACALAFVRLAVVSVGGSGTVRSGISEQRGWGGAGTDLVRVRFVGARPRAFVRQRRVTWHSGPVR